MENLNTIELEFSLQELRSLWHQFCEKHTELYELTCDEYMHLLASDLDKLSESVDEKEILLKYINDLDSKRMQLVQDISNTLNIDQPSKIKALFSELEKLDKKEFVKELEQLNNLLLDIVDKIQEQNKKNQVFLNKALLSLRELKESFTGKTNYKTYSAMGTTKTRSTL